MFASPEQIISHKDPFKGSCQMEVIMYSWRSIIPRIQAWLFAFTPNWKIDHRPVGGVVWGGYSSI